MINGQSISALGRKSKLLQYMYKTWQYASIR